MEIPNTKQEVDPMEEVRKKMEERLPYNRIIKPKAGEILAWLSRSEGQTFLTFLSETRDIYINSLIQGRSDSQGNDLSDVFRGMIKAIDYINSLKAILEVEKVNSQKGA